MVKDYPDVFPEELPGMPLDRDIEFLIELLPGTEPISKRPYRMPAMDMEEISIVLVTQFYSPPQREKGSSMCLGMCQGGPK